MRTRILRLSLISGAVLLTSCGPRPVPPSTSVMTVPTDTVSSTTPETPSTTTPVTSRPPVVTSTAAGHPTVKAPTKAASTATSYARRPVSPRTVYYSSCAVARAAGAAPLHRGEPGYRPGLDRDGDGVACET